MALESEFFFLDSEQVATLHESKERLKLYRAEVERMRQAGFDVTDKEKHANDLETKISGLLRVYSRG